MLLPHPAGCHERSRTPQEGESVRQEEPGVQTVGCRAIATENNQLVLLQRSLLRSRVNHHSCTSIEGRRSAASFRYLGINYTTHFKNPVVTKFNICTGHIHAPTVISFSVIPPSRFSKRVFRRKKSNTQRYVSGAASSP